MKLMKRAFSEFHKFSYEMANRLRSSIYRTILSTLHVLEPWRVQHIYLTRVVISYEIYGKNRMRVS